MVRSRVLAGQSTGTGIGDSSSACECLYSVCMTRRMTATEVKANLDVLLTEIQLGEEIEITRRGRIVARLTPVRGPHALKDRFAGIARTNATDEELYSTGEVWESS